MNVKNYMKDQLENISDALILEAADTDLDYKSEGQIYYIKESFMDKIRRITTAAACFLMGQLQPRALPGNSFRAIVFTRQRQTR